MYKHILIATDGSELAGKAVTTGLKLAKALASKVTAVTATEPWTEMVTEEAARILGDVSAAAKAAGVACETVHAKYFAAEAIIDTAKARGCDLIVMSSHGR